MRSALGGGGLRRGPHDGITQDVWDHSHLFFYKSGRATGLGKAFSRFWSAWASFGLPPCRQVGLEVKGRRTGRPHTIALVIAGYEGEHYLVSKLGECEWVKNVRA